MPPGAVPNGASLSKRPVIVRGGSGCGRPSRRTRRAWRRAARDGIDVQYGEEELLQRPHHRLNRRVDADAGHVGQGIGAGFPIDVGPDMLCDKITPGPRWARAITGGQSRHATRDSSRRTTRVSSPGHAAIALDRCPSRLDEGSFATTIVPAQRAPLTLTCRKPPQSTGGLTQRSAIMAGCASGR